MKRNDIKKMSAARRVSLTASLIALALGLAAVERLIPVPMGVPGMKLGLANMVTLAALYLLGAKTAFGVSVLRVLLAGFLFGGLSSMAYALSGAVASFALMALIKKSDWFGVPGVSIAGGVMHNFAQLMLASLVVDTQALLWYAPALTAAGAVTGLFNGLVVKAVLTRIDR